MRQVFSSARLENVEAVAKMLEDEGIEVRIEHGRSFRNTIRGNFSYREGAGSGPKPSVWVIRSDDQPRARQLMRDAGLLDAPTTVPNRFLAETPHNAMRQRDAQHARKRAARYRYGLVILAAIVAAAVWLKPRPDGSPGTPASPRIDPTPGTLATAADTVHLLPTPPALAAAVATMEQRPGTALCLGIDGADAPAATLDHLRVQGIEAHAASACPGHDALRIEAQGWHTDGSGSGRVDWSVASGTAAATARSAAARRQGDDWQVDTPD